ncbi:LOB domain-containing protein 40-like [Nymphaea colorata]|nr:LOB domain-containing protein 40-like [Nymphaea colorata]
MRMSCNGCRVLRKGCSENCSIRPCLQWIKSPESQANATVFLAKFYGRAGLMNLINAGPEHLRPAIFRSLLYEACGRIVNPIYGSVGLLWSGSWQLCQAAVDAVLKGAPIVQISSESAANPGPLKAYDIRHVAKAENAAALADLHKVKSRNRFKRSGKARPKTDSTAVDPETVANSAEVCNLSWRRCYTDGLDRASSESSSHSEQNGEAETDSMFSNETVEASLLCQADHEREPKQEPSDEEGFGGDGDVTLELTLGFEPVSRSDDDDGHEHHHQAPKEPEFQASLGLELPA